jgi:SAM-dependent methyltransferase
MYATPHEAVRAAQLEGVWTPAPEGDGDPDLAWHRLATGGRWTETGAWVYDFLRRQGLTPDDYLLDVGCGSLSAAIHLLPFMQQSHYWGFEKNIELFIAGSQLELPRAGVAAERGHFIVNDDFDLTEAPPITVAIASSLFRRLSLNGIARCMAGVLTRLVPGGRFYASWLDNPDPRSFEPIDRADGSTSYSDRDPFHYSFEVLAALAEAIGGQVERLDDRSHPRGESIMVITRAEAAR